MKIKKFDTVIKIQGTSKERGVKEQSRKRRKQQIQQCAGRRRQAARARAILDNTRDTQGDNCLTGRHKLKIEDYRVGVRGDGHFKEEEALASTDEEEED